MKTTVSNIFWGFQSIRFFQTFQKKSQPLSATIEDTEGVELSSYCDNPRKPFCRSFYLLIFLFLSIALFIFVFLSIPPTIKQIFLNNLIKLTLNSTGTSVQVFFGQTYEVLTSFRIMVVELLQQIGGLRRTTR